jgi:hypothetical protein
MYVYTPPEQKYTNAKYLFPYIIGFFFLLCLLQIIGQFISVDQLNKASGKIAGIKTKIISYNKGHNPNYALVITLNDGQRYGITDESTRLKLAGLLKVGDQVTIYYPTTFYKILCAGFAHDVNQIELGKQVVYRFEEQKKQSYLLIGMFAVFGCVFWAVRYNMMELYKP